MREILICVTFREFDGSADTEIQWKFLRSISAQTYKNYRLIVTNFQEKNVRSALETSGMPFVMHQSEQDCRFSFTEVVRNVFPHLEEGKHIILWTNADNVFDKNFFEEIIKNFQPGCGGTSYPPMHYKGLDGFTNRQLWNILDDTPLHSTIQMNPNRWVPECDYIDGDIFLKEENQKIFSGEFGEGTPGQAVTLLFAFRAQTLQNLHYRTRVRTISNAHTVERQERVRKKQKGIGIDLIALCERLGYPRCYIPKRHPLSKFYQHRHFKIVGNSFQKLQYALYLFIWYLYSLPLLLLWHLRNLRRQIRTLP